MNWRFQLIVLLISLSSLFALDYEDDEDYDEDFDDEIGSTNSTNNSTLIFIKQLENLTVDQDRKSLRLICEVQNVDVNNTEAKVTFKWVKNEAPIERSKKTNYKTIKLKDNKFRSILTIKNIDLFDRGFYNCTASNGIDRIRSSALIEVGSDGGRYGITSSSSSSSSSSINQLRFETEITTLPPNALAPNVFDAKLLQNPNQQLEAAIRNGQKTFDLSSSFGEVPSQRHQYNFSEPFCQVYSGTMCKTHLENKYVFVQPPYTQKEIEMKLSNAFVVISQSNDISSSCYKFAKPSLCYSAFPLCRDPQKINIYQTNQLNKLKTMKKPNDFKRIRNELAMSLQRICKDDCLMLENELCSKEYAIAKRHPVIGQTLELEECEFLPDETDASSKHCLSLEVNYHSVNKDDTCYWDDGGLYRGIENVSESGKNCIRWSHQFQIHLNEHPELTGHNYCRNPGGIMEQPFCYTDQDVRERCNITNCGDVLLLYIGGISLIITSCVGLIVAIFCCRRRNKVARNLQNMNVPTVDKNIYGNPGPNSPMEMNTLLPPNIPPQRPHHNSKNAYQNVPQYTYKEVAFVEELGEGAFGKVYKGELKTKTGKIFVAVKSLKENANAKTQADFQREIELISELKHANIICLLGVVVKQEPMCMLFEFMSEGDLHEFLIANSPSEGKSLTQTQFLHIAIQIAQGMEYLSDNHYVHRDLAARNCLVSKDLVVKISDFGLSRDMYSCDYYRVQSKSLLPVRWMPPESILYGKFTTESDVWSYGVVLWEIYSYGLQPYYGRNNQEVINMIRYRELLPCPEACPSYCYSLMVECWAELAIRRPSFGEISHRLRVWKQNGNSNGAPGYFKTPENHPAASTSSRSYISSKSESTPTVIGPPAETSWERNRLHESQSSLTSRSSSLGNKTQSTSLSNEQHGNRHRKSRRHEDSLDRPKNTVVSSRNGDFEIKITQ